MPGHLRCATAAVVNPHKNPTKKIPRVRLVFLRVTVDAMKPKVAAASATARSRHMSCVVPSEPIVRSKHRRRRGSGSHVICDQSDHGPLATGGPLCDVQQGVVHLGSRSAGKVAGHGGDEPARKVSDLDVGLL